MMSSTREQPSRIRSERQVKSTLTWLSVILALIAMLLFNTVAAEPALQGKIPPDEVVQIALHHLPLLHRIVPLPSEITERLDSITWEIHMPRALGGLLIGMMLGIAGVAFQSLLGNPLADPYTTGVASGSALGTLLLGTFASTVATAYGGFALTGAAFASGMLAVAIVYSLARVNGRVSAQTFLIAGTIVGSFFFALVPLFLSWTSQNDPQQRASLLSTLFGSLGEIDWAKCGMLSCFCTLGLLWLWKSASELDIMALGEESAVHMGVDTEAFKRQVIVIGGLLTAATVAVAGIIAFVGFLVPHVARRLVGSNHRHLVPMAALLGGLVVMLADCLSRVVLHDLEIGVITSLLGVPFFCLLMRKEMVSRR